MGFLYFGLIAYMFAGYVTAAVLLHKIDPRPMHQQEAPDSLPADNSDSNSSTP
ncbi:MAG: hypothetical protein ACAI35_25170 [Candidatus Methylacidiphilales bacterium]|nr:hypothetical protein [Candidatus Methylacidiphilales bacterium]